MRITIDLSPAVHRHAGLGRYASELLAALCAFDRADTFAGFSHAPVANPPEESRPAGVPLKAVSLSAKPWRMSVLSAYFAGVAMDPWLPRGDVFHATEHLLPPLKDSKTVFTLHDLIFRFFPEYHLPLNRWYLSLMLPRFLKRADAIIAVSEWTKRDAIRLYDLPAEKITVIHEGVNPALHPTDDPDSIARVRARYARNQPFIFLLSTIEPRKNIPTLIDALRVLRSRGLPHRLLISGRKGWLFQSTFDHVKQAGMEDAVDFLDYVPDADLPALLSACGVFVFPSLYEGFGLPPLEAMACGAPVICSNAASLPEVVGDAALLVDPRDTNELADAIQRVLSDASLREQLCAKSLERAAQFSWERTARETLRVYHAAVEGFRC